MALSNYKKSESVEVKGVINLDDMNIEIENLDEPIAINDLLKEFDGLDIRITIKRTEEL